MSTTAYTSEPASELERLIADLPGSGLLAFVLGVGWWVAHLEGRDNARCSADRPTGAGGTSSSATTRRA